MKEEFEKQIAELKDYFDQQELKYSSGVLSKIFKNRIREIQQKKVIIKLLEDYISEAEQSAESARKELSCAQEIFQTKISDLNDLYKNAIAKYDSYTKENENYKEQMERQVGAAARQLMKIKWRLIDQEAEKNEKGSDILQCKICGYKGRRDSFETKVTECRFNGGKLVRYICPQCGVIFGPTKFSALSQEEINDDYSAHYLGFHEGDSTQKEIDAFFLLKPEKDKIYLNYGCGCWSKSMEFLRSEGYQVFGYEPYAPDIDNPYMITDKNKISKMRFDGIFSNDLIEHLINPVEDFKFMKSILKDMHSKMSHSTSCYIYKHEVTRFHTHFFTGKSIDVLCEKAGLNVIQKVNEVDSKDFICYVYAPKDLNMEYTDQLCGLEQVNGMYHIKPEKDMYGPYITVGEGNYRWMLEINGLNETDRLFCRITEQAGKETIAEIVLSEGANILEFFSDHMIYDLEFVIHNTLSYDIIVKKLEMLD